MNLDNFQVCDQDLSDDLLSRYLGVNLIAVDTETMGLIQFKAGKNRKN